MAQKFTKLRINAERLGSIQEIKQLLSDFENAYNHLFAFNFIVDTLYENFKIQRNTQRENDFTLENLRSQFFDSNKYPFDPFIFEFLYSGIYYNQHNISKPALLDLYNKVDIDQIIFPTERLQITRVNIQSPGFWEFSGISKVLEQIREYLKDRHERIKDNSYRNRQEEEKGELDIIAKKESIINQRIETLRKIGCNEVEVRQFVIQAVTQPLGILGKQQANGFIEGPEE